MRRWYGNNEYLVDWENDGEEIFAFCNYLNSQKASTMGVASTQFYFKNGITWNLITSGKFSIRFYPKGMIFDIASPSFFPFDENNHNIIGCFLNSNIAAPLIECFNQTLNTSPGLIEKLPLKELPKQTKIKLVKLCDKTVMLGKSDWDAYERSWDFQSLPLLSASNDLDRTLESSYTAWIAQNRDSIAEMQRLEEENNRLFIDAYGLADELTPEVPLEQITLTVNPAYRYGGKLTEEQLWTRFRQDSMEELISYAVGCMMGRYSLDAPGLIYAHSKSEGFDPSQYTTFPADDDGILPLTDTRWFDDDAASRLEEFMAVAWPAAHLEANLTFLAENLSPRKGESSRETLRRYLSDSFFKDHLQTYKKRPIYWLFSSGKQKAFQCLVYLHRYNAGTLSRLRNKYVVPLQGKLNARIEQLEDDIPAATSTSHRKQQEKERDKLIKQREELQTFDETLRHYSDLRIDLDLDEGVKVNYSKFGNLLAEVKAITGKKAK